MRARQHAQQHTAEGDPSGAAVWRAGSVHRPRTRLLRRYCIPPDNPFARGSIARPEIWAWGLRNPWRFSFDSADGSLWIGDVGQNRWEEVNHAARPNV